MKILDNNVVRDMTAEEIEMFSCVDIALTETEEKAKAYDILTGVAE